MMIAQILLAAWLIAAIIGALKAIETGQSRNRFILELTTTILVFALLVVVCYKAGSFSTLL